MRARMTASAVTLAPQFPGFGDREARADVRLTDVADEIAALLTDAASRPHVVCGLSMGGYVALDLVARYPELVDGLILANTRAEADSPEARAGRDAGIARVRSEGTGPFLDGLVPNLMAEGVDPAVAGAVRGIADRQSAAAIAGALAAMRDRDDHVGTLPTITVPAAVVQGAEDRVTPPEAIDRLVSEIPGAERHVIDGVGHLSAREDPAAFAAVVDAMIARVAGV